MNIYNLSPTDVERLLRDDAIVLIDVREPAEYALERIDGALLFPLSTFDPHALPECGTRRVVFHCGSGVRSMRAISACHAAGLPYDSHMKGGIQAWKAAGLPTVATEGAPG